MRLIIVVFVFFSSLVLSGCEDEAIDKSVQTSLIEFFANGSTPPKENGLFALAGLFSAENTNDFVLEGQKKVELARQTFFDVSAAKSSIAPPSLALVAPENLVFGCILSNQRDAKCANTRQVKGFIKKNETLIERFRSLSSFSSFQGDYYPLSFHFNLIEPLARLVNDADLIQAQEEDPSVVMKSWLKEMLFWQSLFSSQITAVNKIALYPVYEVRLSLLPRLLSVDNKLISKFAPRIQSVLTKNISAMFHMQILDSSLKAEFHSVIKPFIDNFDSLFLSYVKTFRPGAEQFLPGVFYDKSELFKANATVNLWHQFITRQDKFFSDKSTLPGTDEHFVFIDYHDYFSFRDLFNAGVRNKNGTPNIVGSTLISTIENPLLSIAAYTLNVNRISRFYHVYVTAKAGNVIPSDMPTFLSTVDSQFHDPVTGKPYYWDEKRNRLFFLYNPGTMQAKKEYILY